jgi:hypothetical protein
MRKAPLLPGLFLSHCFNYSELEWVIFLLDVVEEKAFDVGRGLTRFSTRPCLACSELAARKSAGGHFVFTAAFASEAAVGVFEETVQFGGCSSKGVVDVGRLCRGYEGSVMPGTGFENATFVSRAVGAIFVGFACEMNFDAGEIGVKTTEYVEDVISDGI